MLYDVHGMHARVRLRDPYEEYARLCMETKMMMTTDCLSSGICIDCNTLNFFKLFHVMKCYGLKNIQVLAHIYQKSVPQKPL